MQIIYVNKQTKITLSCRLYAYLMVGNRNIWTVGRLSYGKSVEEKTHICIINFWGSNQKLFKVPLNTSLETNQLIFANFEWQRLYNYV